MIVEIWRFANVKKQLAYIERPKPNLAQGFVPIGSNVQARGAPSCIARFEAIARRRPDVREPFVHIVVSLGVYRFNRPWWHHVVRRVLQLLGLKTELHLYYAGLHQSEVEQHCHIVASRTGIDGSLWLGKFERWAAIEAARTVAADLGITRWSCTTDIPQHHKVVRVNRVLEAEGKGLIICQSIHDRLLDCLHRSSCRSIEGFIEAARLTGIDLEVRPGPDGMPRGICLIAPTKSGHRLRLSNVTANVFSWTTLNEFFESRSGRLFEFFKFTEGAMDYPADEDYEFIDDAEANRPSHIDVDGADPDPESSWEGSTQRDDEYGQ